MQFHVDNKFIVTISENKKEWSIGYLGMDHFAYGEEVNHLITYASVMTTLYRAKEVLRSASKKYDLTRAMEQKMLMEEFKK